MLHAEGSGTTKSTKTPKEWSIVSIIIYIVIFMSFQYHLLSSKFCLQFVSKYKSKCKNVGYVILHYINASKIKHKNR